MKKRLITNLILFDIVPIIYCTILFFILFIKYKAWIAILIIIPLISHLIILIKNIKNLKSVQNRINNLGKIIYDDGHAILSNTSIISTKGYFFSIDYEDIKHVYTRKRMFVNYRANSLCIITKKEKKYELVYLSCISPFSSKNKQIKEIIKIIKSHNFDVKEL